MAKRGNTVHHRKGAPPPIGMCKLTGEVGPFVDAHILPKALTRPSRSGAPLYQKQSGRRPVKRWTSWYDRAIVTAEDEGILAGYDNWAIKELRRHELVWSGWGSMTSLPLDRFDPIPGSPWGIRKIADIDANKLRLFFLSVIWRAAASTLPEFEEVELPPEKLELLREMVKRGVATPVDFLPISLTQLSTKGIIHNLGIIRQTKILPGLPGLPAQNVPYFRIYIDGLIAHVAIDGYSVDHVNDLGPFMVGLTDEVIVSTVTFENSFEFENISNIERQTLK